MASRVARYVLGTVGCVVGIVPSTGLSQSPAALARGEESERVAASIRAAQAEEGADSAALVGPLTELSVLYEAEGEHALATAALEQARQVVRANYGLHTLDQVPLIRKALENQQALGNFAMVHALEEELFALAERFPDDLRTVVIHRELGERRMDLLRRFLAGEAPAEIYGEPVYSFQGGNLMQDLVSEAQIHYADAAAVILRNGLYSSEELRDLEMAVVRASDVFRQRFRPTEREADGSIRNTPREDYGVGQALHQWWNYTLETLRTRANELWDLADPAASQDADRRRLRVDHITTRHQLGRESYLRLIAYDDAVWSTDPNAWRRRLEAHLQLADWDLLYSENGAALEDYASVHALLENTAMAEPLVATIFAPPIPIVLPTFLPNPLETQVSATYIDVAFEITKYGEGRRIEILGATPSVSDNAKRELEILIKSSRFRPRVTDGELARASRVVVRYYLND
jgi:hypothetical protein